MAVVAGIAVLITIACSSGDSATATPSATGVPDAANVTEVAAPIESVEIEKIAAKPPNATLKVVSGGLNSCETFKDYNLTRDGDAFRLRVTNLRESAPGIPCTAIYGTVSHDIELPSAAIEACEIYTVEVNGEMYSVPSSCPSVPSGQFAEPTPTPAAAGLADRDMVSIPAPILSAEIMAAESFPVQYFLEIESGLRNGCVEFEGHEVRRESESITVTVTNLEPADKDIACTEIYRTVTTSIRLGTGADFDPATTYTVLVNDVTTSFTTEGEAPAAGLPSGPTATPPAAVPAGPDMVSVPAPILGAKVIVAESFPVQYFLKVESELGNGCVEFEGYEVRREGKSITVTVTNLVPADQLIACTLEYRTETTNIRLGSGADFDPATTYTVSVNDVTTSFTTEGEAPEPGRVAATLGSPFQLKTGETASLDEQGPVVEFVEVVEDSRCALDVVCIQAGRARVLLRVSSPGDVLGFGTPELTLEAGLVNPEAGAVTGVFDEYRFELSVLDPYPRTTAPQPPDYTATIVVTKVPKSP
jgi:hypothetical protein